MNTGKGKTPYHNAPPPSLNQSKLGETDLSFHLVYTLTIAPGRISTDIKCTLRTIEDIKKRTVIVDPEGVKKKFNGQQWKIMCDIQNYWNKEILYYTGFKEKHRQDLKYQRENALVKG